MSDRWIVIPNWDPSTGTDGERHEGFQHYTDRDPKWIKSYRAQLSKEEYLGLTFHQRGVLHGLRLAYAASNRQLSDNTLTLTRRLGQRVAARDLEALNHAGLIEFAASPPIAPVYRRARLDKKEEKKEPRVSAGEQKPPGLWTPARGPSDPAAAIRREISNGSISDTVDLDAALRAHPDLTSDQRESLRASLLAAA